jgi:hypothetical protein
MVVRKPSWCLSNCGSDLVRLKYVGAGNPLGESLARESWDKLLDERDTVKWIEAG